MKFCYRYVPFGTRFVQTPGLRAATGLDGSGYGSADGIRRLHANELVVDVGGVCWGHLGDPQEEGVLDHHFHRRGQFPSAAAAVLHNADRVYERFERLQDPDATVWLVTHHQPDFDAYSAMYLARGIIQGLDETCSWHIPHQGWQPLGLRPDGCFEEGIDWYKPPVGWLPREHRWSVLLASLAAHVDNCRPTKCPPNRRLDAVLYAAVQRGRQLLDCGAVALFDEVRSATHDASPPLNPLCDSVLEGSVNFAPELALLDREPAAYQRDLQRARRTIVYVQRADRPFRQWFADAAVEPLLDAELRELPRHRHPAGNDCLQVDGLLLRDPECLLFKHWARTDTGNSSMGGGFVFTAVAYSNGRPNAVRNKTDYYFALDPERAASDGLHLYNVWANLQAEEIRALVRADDPDVVSWRSELGQPLSSGNSAGERCRKGFEGRAGADLRPLFADPWFDGSNYGCSIVPTPNHGTVLLSRGSKADLSDDRVVDLVLSELQGAALSKPVAVQWFTLKSDRLLSAEFPNVSDAIADGSQVPADAYCFWSTELAASVDPTSGDTALEIGRRLWRLLDAEHESGVPSDFVARHLMLDTHGIRVWSRRGVAVAEKPIQGARSALSHDFAQLMDLTKRAERIVAGAPCGDDRKELNEVVSSGAALMRDVIKYHRALAQPQGRLLRRFFGASGLDDYLEGFHNLHVNHSNRLIGGALDRNLHTVAHVQNAIEWLEVFIMSYYTVSMAHYLGESFDFPKEYVGWSLLLLGTVAAVATALGLDLGKSLRPARRAASHDHPTAGSHGDGADSHVPRYAGHPDALDHTDDSSQRTSWRLLRAIAVITCLLAGYCIIGLNLREPGSPGEGPGKHSHDAAAMPADAPSTGQRGAGK